MQMIKKMAKWLVDNGFENNPLHFSRFYPTYKLLDAPATPVKTLEKAAEIAKAQGMKFVYIGNVWGHKLENTYCPHCGKLLIKRFGFNVEEINISDGKCKFCGAPIAGIWND
jgi:pyruvate formate lyase activating enzyme